MCFLASFSSFLPTLTTRASIQLLSAAAATSIAVTIAWTPPLTANDAEDDGIRRDSTIASTHSASPLRNNRRGGSRTEVVASPSDESDPSSDKPMIVSGTLRGCRFTRNVAARSTSQMPFKMILLLNVSNPAGADGEGGVFVVDPMSPCVKALKEWSTRWEETLTCRIRW